VYINVYKCQTLCSEGNGDLSLNSWQLLNSAF